MGAALQRYALRIVNNLKSDINDLELGIRALDHNGFVKQAKDLEPTLATLRSRLATATHTYEESRKR